MSKIDNIDNIDKNYINELLNELAESRPIFHNEKDFQFELANKIREYINNENIVVRLEYFIGESLKEIKNKYEKSKTRRKRIYIDIMIIEKNKIGPNKAIAIELKYKTKESIGMCKNEDYELTNQGAQDWGCYDIYKDLKRIENLVYDNKDDEEEYKPNNIVIEKGYVIFLTNDVNSYKRKRTGIFKNYALIDEDNGKTVTKEEGKISYCHKEKPYKEYDYENILNEHKCNNYLSVKDKRPINLEKEHYGEWSRYSKIEGKPNTETTMQDELEKLIFAVPKEKRKEQN